MVKGVSKQAVIVPSPDPKKFEQAIFIVSGEEGCPVESAGEMVEMACRLASRCAVSSPPGKRRLRRSLVPVLSFLLGSGVTAAAGWLFFFVL